MRGRRRRRRGRPPRAAISRRRSVPSTAVWRDLRVGLCAAWIIVSAPRTAASMTSPVSKSPLMVPGRPLRLITRGSIPSARSRSTIRLPSLPVPPVTTTSRTSITKISFSFVQ